MAIGQCDMQISLEAKFQPKAEPAARERMSSTACTPHYGTKVYILMYNKPVLIVVVGRSQKEAKECPRARLCGIIRHEEKK